AQPFLAADVGGTHARLASVRTHERGVELIAYRKLACSDFASLADLLRLFLKTDATGPIRHCVLACAGQVIDDEVIHDNLAWPINISALRGALDFDELFVLNDFEALGYALADVAQLDTRLLHGPDVAAAGPKLVVGPGTGLGAAVHLPNGSVIATEAGQMDFAAQTLREREVLACLVPDGGYVPCERLLSGPGLLAFYETLCALNGASPWLDTPEAVTDAARQRTDANASEAVDPFCGALPARTQHPDFPGTRSGSRDGARPARRAGRRAVLPRHRRARRTVQQRDGTHWRTIEKHMIGTRRRT